MKHHILSSIILGSASFILGSILTSIINNHVSKNKDKVCGTLRIDTYEANEPAKLFLEITDVELLDSSSVVKLKVVKENYIDKHFA